MKLQKLVLFLLNSKHLNVEILKNPSALEITFCFADDLAGAGFNGINAVTSRVLMALQPCGTLGAGFNGTNSLASHVLTALQPFDTLLPQ